MKTNEQILATWETEGIYTDWCAVDSYHPEDGTIVRVFVGTEAECMGWIRRALEEPTGMAMQPFYRMALLPPDDARAWFEGERHVIDERSTYSLTEVAGILGVSRQRVHQLLKAGRLEGRKVGNAWSIYRYSVESLRK